MNNYEMFLKVSEESIDNLHDKIDKELMKNFIIPFCKKYQFRFISGMGTYMFYSKSNKIEIETYYDQRILKKKTIFWVEFLLLCDLIEDINYQTKFLGGGYEYKAKRKGDK